MQFVWSALVVLAAPQTDSPTCPSISKIADSSIGAMLRPAGWSVCAPQLRENNEDHNQRQAIRYNSRNCSHSYCLKSITIRVRMILAISPSCSQLFSLDCCHHHHHRPQVWHLLCPFFSPPVPCWKRNCKPLKKQTSLCTQNMHNGASLEKSLNPAMGPVILGELLSCLTHVCPDLMGGTHLCFVSDHKEKSANSQSSTWLWFQMRRRKQSRLTVKWILCGMR